MKQVAIEEMVGQRFSRVTSTTDTLTFVAESGKEYAFRHKQDCCETVSIADITGDLNDLVGFPLTMAEEIVSAGGDPPPEYPDSWTWTYYKFATIKGYVTVRWLGESNGYYSESVELYSTPLKTLYKAI
jgi:hypothetical protein